MIVPTEMKLQILPILSVLSLSSLCAAAETPVSPDALAWILPAAALSERVRLGVELEQDSLHDASSVSSSGDGVVERAVSRSPLICAPPLRFAEHSRSVSGS